MKHYLVADNSSEYCLCEWTAFIHNAVGKVVFSSGDLDCHNVVRMGKIDVSNYITHLDFQVVFSCNEY